jgi:hypothetical protein
MYIETSVRQPYSAIRGQLIGNFDTPKLIFGTRCIRIIMHVRSALTEIRRLLLESDVGGRASMVAHQVRC